MCVASIIKYVCIYKLWKYRVDNSRRTYISNVPKDNGLNCKWWTPFETICVWAHNEFHILPKKKKKKKIKIGAKIQFVPCVTAPHQMNRKIKTYPFFLFSKKKIFFVLNSRVLKHKKENGALNFMFIYIFYYKIFTHLFVCSNKATSNRMLNGSNTRSNTNSIHTDIFIKIPISKKTFDRCQIVTETHIHPNTVQ